MLSARLGIYIAASCLITTGWLATADAQEANLDVPAEVVAGAASGTANGEPVLLPVGSYSVRWRGGREPGSDVMLQTDDETLVTLN